MYHSSNGDFVGFLEGKLKLNAINNLSLTINRTHFQFVAFCRFRGLFPGLCYFASDANSDRSTDFEVTSVKKSLFCF